MQKEKKKALDLFNIFTWRRELDNLVVQSGSSKFVLRLEQGPTGGTTGSKNAFLDGLQRISYMSKILIMHHIKQ